MGRRKHRGKGFTELQELLRELDRMPGCEHTKRGVRDLLRRAAGLRMYLARSDLVQPYRIDQACHLLDMGCHPTEVRARIVLRFGVSRDTAERVVSAALRRPRLAASDKPEQLDLLPEDAAP